MTQAIYPGRDLRCLMFLHAHKVATAKQLHQMIFNNAKSNFYKTLKKYKQLNWIESTFGKDFDGSSMYSLTSKGFNEVKRYYESSLAHKRFKSNSVTHDLHLIKVKDIFTRKSQVSDYFTENQIQTFTDFDTEDELIPFKSLGSDAMFTLSKLAGCADKTISIALELELSGKSINDYNRKLQHYYLESSIHAVFYICSSKALERRIMQVDESLCKSKDHSKVYLIQLNEFLKDEQTIAFTKINGRRIFVE